MPPDYYPWLKALHIAFMVTWFAGLFYLPRLFIYHAEAADEPGRRRFTVMENRLFAIMTIGELGDEVVRRSQAAAERVTP